MSRFADLIAPARRFLTDFAAHNDRAWFEAHKALYEACIKIPGRQFGDRIGADLARRPDRRLDWPGFACAKPEL